MQTSLARRQRHRRALHGSPKTHGRSAVGRVLLVIFLIFLVITLLTAGTGLVFAVGAYNHYAAGLPEPKDALTTNRCGGSEETSLCARAITRLVP